MVRQTRPEDLDRGPVDGASVRFGGIPARIGSGQERFDCIGVGGLVDHGVDIDGYAVSVAEADGDGNTVNDGVAPIPASPSAPTARIRPTISGPGIAPRD